jgi:flagellar P-ring protein FlgI
VTCHRPSDLRAIASLRGQFRPTGCRKCLRAATDGGPKRPFRALQKGPALRSWHGRPSFPLAAIALIIGLFCSIPPGLLAAGSEVRVKDIAHFSSSREYQIIGYGLVTGLNGTGDKSPMSLEMMRGMLVNMGMDLDKSQIESKNCAAVVVTAMIPPFGRPGERFDVTVSSIGDCKSLQGGVLLPTLLKAGDGRVYAVAQGHVSIGGFEAGTGAGGAGTGAAAPQKNHLTVARVPQGAIQERSVGDSFGGDGICTLLLQRKDPGISRQVKEAIDRRYGEGWAKVPNPGTVEVKIPASFKDDPVSFAATLLDLHLTIEDPNRVVINERTGTIIVGNRVRISRVTISQNALRLEVAPKQGAPATTGANRRDTTPPGSLISLTGETTVDDLVKALNAVGATPKDLIAIFQAIEAAGALHGELRIM